MLGYDREELLQLRVLDLVVERDEGRDHYAEMVRGVRSDGVSVLRTKDGREIAFEYLAGETTVAGMTYYVSIGRQAS